LKKLIPLVKIVAIAIIVTLAANAQSAEYTKDSLATVKKAVEAGTAVLVDVREKVEWDDGHLKVAQSLPLSSLKNAAKAKDAAQTLPKGKTVYCHCAAGVRCLKAADELKKLGYDVQPLQPGYADLLKAGFAPADR
jgi:phage shock protein E